jgi:hypothetical protein
MTVGVNAGLNLGLSMIIDDGQHRARGVLFCSAGSCRDQMPRCGSQSNQDLATRAPRTGRIRRSGGSGFRESDPASHGLRPIPPK